MLTDSSQRIEIETEVANESLRKACDKKIFVFEVQDETRASILLVILFIGEHANRFGNYINNLKSRYNNVRYIDAGVFFSWTSIRNNSVFTHMSSMEWNARQFNPIFLEAKLREKVKEAIIVLLNGTIDL